MNGVLYASFKHGETETSDEIGRFFNNYTSDGLVSLLDSLDGFEVLACWEETKPLRNNSQTWVNVLARKVRT
jgi:hypothetical protein